MLVKGTPGIEITGKYIDGGKDCVVVYCNVYAQLSHFDVFCCSKVPNEFTHVL